MSILVRSPFVALVVIATLWWNMVVPDFDQLLSKRNLISVGCICLIAVVSLFLAYARKAHDSAKVIAGFIWLFCLGILVFSFSGWTAMLTGLLLCSGLSLGVFAETQPTSWWRRFRSMFSRQDVYVVTDLPIYQSSRR
jgi:hypothetical protein